MTRSRRSQQNPSSWLQLCQLFDTEFGLPNRTDRKSVAVGSLCLSRGQWWHVRVYAGEDGLVAVRFLWPFMVRRTLVSMAWRDIESVTEFSSGIRKYEIAQDQSNSFLTFRGASFPPMMIPWCDKFSGLIPATVQYEDRKSVHWHQGVQEYLE